MGEKVFDQKTIFYWVWIDNFYVSSCKKNPNPFPKHYTSLLEQKFGEKQQIAEISI